jgi:hypothetical protein
MTGGDDDPDSQRDRLLGAIFGDKRKAEAGEAREKTSKRLEAMRRNPRADWTISDVEAVCREHDLNCDPPRGGSSHYKVSHPKVNAILTVPSRRPIKPVYIRKLVEMIDLVRDHP